MAIKNIVTDGIGPGATIANLVTEGFVAASTPTPSGVAYPTSPLVVGRLGAR